MEDSYGMQLTFTETHLAEIQAVLPRLRADDGVADSENTLAMDDSVAWEDGQAIQPVLPIGKLSSSSTGNECGGSTNQEIDKENEPDKEALVFPVHITGEEAGDYKLVVYNGKLKRYTALKPEQRFISIVHHGRNKLIAVSLIEQEKSLYVAKQIYRTYSVVIQKMQSLPMQKP